MRAQALTALGLLAAVPACASPPPAPPSLTAEVRQYRSDVPLRMLSVTTTNDEASAVTVERVQLLARAFVALPAAVVDVRVPAGDRVDVPAAYGRPRCGAEPAGGVDVARMTVRRPDGSRFEVVVPLPPGGGLLARLRASDCAQQAVRAAVSIGLGPRWVRRGDRMEGSLVVRRRQGDEPVEVREAAGHIVFTVRGALPAVLAPGQEELTVPLVLTPTRCDGHALSENSRGAVFPFVVSVGGDAPVKAPATATPQLHARLQDLAVDVCQPRG